MPYRVDKRGSQYCVINKDTGETQKCYDNKSDADKYNTALNMAHARSQGYINSSLPLEEEVVEQLRLMDDDLKPWHSDD